MQTLALKLLLTPLFIGLASLAGRRWGARVSGWLIGLPLTSAPLTLILAIDQGTRFAAHTAQGILLGFVSQALFCLTYAWLSLRLNWWICWLVGWGVFFAATAVFAHVAALLPMIFVGVILAILLILLLWPKRQAQTSTIKGSVWEIPARMVVATAFVLGLTTIAPALGPQVSGLLAPLPIFATVFATFTQRLHGAAAARQILLGVVTSSFACAAFFLVIAGLIEPWGMLAAFSVATLAALLTQGGVLWLARRLSRARASQASP